MKGIIPELINDYRVFVNASTDLRGLADIQLPSIEAMTETLSGAGIAGEVETDVLGHFKSMKLTLNWRMVTDELIDFLSPSQMLIDCRVVNQEYDSTNGTREYKPNKVLVKGKCLKRELGKVKAASPYDASTEIEVVYLKMERNGKIMLEIDKYNYIFIVDGVDHMKQLRTALGME